MPLCQFNYKFYSVNGHLLFSLFPFTRIRLWRDTTVAIMGYRQENLVLENVCGNSNRLTRFP